MILFEKFNLYVQNSLKIWAYIDNVSNWNMWNQIPCCIISSCSKMNAIWIRFTWYLCVCVFVRPWTCCLLCTVSWNFEQIHNKEVGHYVNDVTGACRMFRLRKNYIDIMDTNKNAHHPNTKQNPKTIWCMSNWETYSVIYFSRTLLCSFRGVSQCMTGYLISSST